MATWLIYVLSHLMEKLSAGRARELRIQGPTTDFSEFQKRLRTLLRNNMGGDMWKHFIHYKWIHNVFFLFLLPFLIEK